MTDWVNLARRQAGLPPETEMVEDASGHLHIPINHWIDRARLSVKRSYWDKTALQAGISTADRSSKTLLTLVDFYLYWYPQATSADRNSWAEPLDWKAHIAELEQTLLLGRSAWRVGAKGDGLERRIEETATTAMRQTVTTSPPVSQDHLLSAWAAVYGRDPNPDLAYNEAMRAVEELICPLVQPEEAKKGQSTLGKVIIKLRKTRDEWELLLPGKDGHPRDIDHLIGMLELLWHSQVSRHGGAPKSRRQDQDEARAAVHLAVTLVQWLSTSVLRPRTTHLS